MISFGLLDQVPVKEYLVSERKLFVLIKHTWKIEYRIAMVLIKKLKETRRSFDLIYVP